MTKELMYNTDVKNQYLSQFDNEDTKEVYARLFRKAYEVESEFGTDIYNFDDAQIEHFLANVLKPKTKESARTYCNVLANYIQWAIDNPNIVRDSVSLTNPMKRRQEYFYEFVQDTKLYFSIHEKEAIMTSLTNKQDSVIIDGLWEGIQGTKLSELVNLRISDVKYKDKVIVLRDDKGNEVRKIDYSNRDLADVTIFENAVLANREYEYFKMNGTVDYSANVRESVFLPVKSDYVLKSAPTNSKNNEKGGEKVSYYTVYNRLEMIRKLDEFSEYVDALTTKNIVRSGMIYMALKVYKRDGELGRKQIEEICERYNMKYKWSLRDFLNTDTLKQLYPDEMGV